MAVYRVRKRPVEVEAMLVTAENIDEACTWAGGERPPLNDAGDLSSWFLIDTLEGAMRVDMGNWVIKGVKVEFYPCRADIFDESYEMVT
jgi:hypothetical protein